MTENYLPVTWKRVLPVWWAMTWRTWAINLAIIGALYGIIGWLGISSGTKFNVGFNKAEHPILSPLFSCAMIMAIIIIMWMFISCLVKIVFSKKFGEFSIKFFPVALNENSFELSWKRAVKIGWAMAWRSILYTILLYIAITTVIALGDYLINNRIVNIRLNFGGLFSTVIAALVSLLVIKTVLNKKFREFTIKLIANNEKKVQNV